MNLFPQARMKTGVPLFDQLYNEMLSTSIETEIRTEALNQHREPVDEELASKLPSANDLHKSTSESVTKEREQAKLLLENWLDSVGEKIKIASGDHKQSYKLDQEDLIDLNKIVKHISWRNVVALFDHQNLNVNYEWATNATEGNVEFSHFQITW